MGSDWSDTINNANREIDKLLLDVGDGSSRGVLSDTFVKGGDNKFLSPRESLAKDEISPKGPDEIGKRIENIIKRALS